MEVLVSLEELMMEFRNVLGSWLDKDTLIVLSKKILSRRSEIARFLYKPDVWKEPEDNSSNNSQCAVNSGHGKAKEGNRSNNSQGAGKSGHRKAKENNKGKKNKGGKKKGKK
ncbi:hypothetical protein P8452_33632 [Trifolium repens]|nr:hypothetical protein P8452_33632 [Trifolium repens]